jgi:rubredoxin
MTYTCENCGGEYEGEKAYLDHLPCGRRTVAEDVQIFSRLLYDGARPDEVCGYCGERKPKSPCPHCGRP